MAKQDVNREDVLAAIAEFDSLGQVEFLGKCGMRKATGYLLHHGGNENDSKPILAAAHGHHPGLKPLTSDDFNGGESDAVKYLCGFDFVAAYGPHGEGYIECHHVIPLHASGEVKTRLEDLVLICANCHRMIHRRAPWLTPAQLRAFIDAQP